MKKILAKILIILTATIGLLAHGSGAFCHELSKTTLENFIINEVKTQTATQLKDLRDVEIEVKVMNFAPGSITTPGDSSPEIKVVSNFPKFNPNDMKRVIISSNGTVVRTIPVSVKISVYKNVLVAKEYITQFQMITGANTYYKRVDISRNIQNTIGVDEFDTPRVAARNFPTDSVILSNYTKTKPDVLRNTPVKIIFNQSDNFNIEIDGIATTEGRIGDVITVKNTKYNKVHTATIVGTNTVEVTL